MNIKKYLPYLIGVFFGVVYGVFAQLLVRAKLFSYYDDIFVVMSLGYIFVLPVVIGLLTVFFAPEPARNNWIYIIFMPWLSMAICLGISLAVGWEGMICLVTGGVLFIPLSSIGGIVAWAILKIFETRKLQGFALGIFLIAPQTMGLLESRFDPPEEMHEVMTSIAISSSADKVWDNIKIVPKITEDIGGFFYHIGFPKPVEATLSHEGVGGVRHAVFDKNLVFIETITDWEPQKYLSFTIKADPEAIPVTTLDEHVVVGGRYFDVLRGTYAIEKKSDDDVVLHLSSHFRLSTHFNFYSSIWARFLMKDIQESILEVIKTRCEKM